jgi:hypothetical protein
MGTVHIVGDELVALAAALRLAQMRHVTRLSPIPTNSASIARPDLANRSRHAEGIWRVEPSSGARGRSALSSQRGEEEMMVTLCLTWASRKAAARATSSSPTIVRARPRSLASW